MKAPRAVTPRALKELRAKILHWYGRNRRELPWRNARDPYATWVSEIMLQQTRVETVIPFYERFLARFPTVERLARAREADVLAAWSGLGYYARARRLHAAARVVAGEHGGRIPKALESLRRLPGIGPYTAAAIASVAHGIPAAAVDGNAIRVLARIFGRKGRTGRRDDSSLRAEVESIAERLARGPSPGDWTQALMELGALVCTPRVPRCDLCPAAGRCAARRSGDAPAYPLPARAAAAVKERKLVMLAAIRDGRVLLVREGTSGSGWSLPIALTSGSSRSSRAAASRLTRTWVPGARLKGPGPTFRHRTYAEDLRYEVWEARAGSETVSDDARWAHPGSLGKMPLRSPTLKALNKLRVRVGRP